jgi:general L-amino acid transport system permease protein
MSCRQFDWDGGFDDECVDELFDRESAGRPWPGTRDASGVRSGSIVADAGVSRRPISWSNPKTRAILWQALIIVVVCGVAAMIALQTTANLKSRGITSGFDYLKRAAGFEVTPGPVHYSSSDTYARALGLGFANTLRVGALAIILATTFGVLLGIARLSKIWVVSAAARGYVEVLRNTPLLLQLLFWYSLSQALPGPRDALQPLRGVFLCIRGLFLPRVVVRGGYFWLASALLVLAILACSMVVRSRRMREQTGRGLPTIWLLTSAAGALLPAAIVLGHPVVTIEQPALAGFDFHGGLSISPEFAALLIGLSTYTAAFIAEIVRGGILAVDRGQAEAASALGLSRGRVLRRVVLPQALRVIIPPTTSQYLNLVKNSSLAVAIGYPDLISITSTTLNQTGQAIEAITLAMIVYLSISLMISLAMNFYNGAVMQRELGVQSP